MSEELKEIKEEKTRKRTYESAEDFIGWKSEDGNLEVIDIVEKCKRTKFKVICHKCKDDKELFPLGYFVSQKVHLVNGKKPCGCAFNPKWNKDQFLILARRALQDKFIVHSFSGEFHGSRTKLNLECLVEGHKWVASIYKVINNGTGCPKCSNKYRPTEQEALDKCKIICETEEYESLGFVDGYKNTYSRFEYKCQKHGIQNVSYNSFINNGCRCKGCWKEKQKELLSGFYGYYPERKDEVDFLYVLDFDSKFLKVGRSFNIDGRIVNLKSVSKIKKIHKLRIFTATHQEIYDTEQEILEELRERGFQYRLKWTKEAFDNDCLFVLNKLLDSSGLGEVI